MYGQANISYNGPSSSASSGPNPPGVSIPFIGFAVGDGQPGSPVDGDTSLIAATLQGQSLIDVQILAIREGIQVLYNTAVATNNIRRYNDGLAGGFVLEDLVQFHQDERWQLFIVGTNTTIEI